MNISERAPVILDVPSDSAFFRRRSDERVPPEGGVDTGVVAFTRGDLLGAEVVGTSSASSGGNTENKELIYILKRRRVLN